jgi:hypothetical protein
MATNGNIAAQEQSTTASSSDAAGFTSSSNAGAPSATTSSSNSNLSKDEVGWFFVEQYYTTLSKSPEKLHLFYGKRSQFVYGLEAEVTNISVGRQAIQERIAQLDFQDCKVRISNVDSQASFESIVIQVIGETSNKAGEPKKFVQTFVLAQQPSGYFVLNDILRYVDEESNEQPAEAAEETSAQELEAEGADAPIPVQSEVEAPKETLDADAVEQKLQESAPTPKAVAEPAAEPPVEAAKPVEPATEKAVDPEAAAREVEAEDVQEPEKPQDPSPTPALKAAAPAPAPESKPAPAEPAAPPKPMTWASRAAAAAGPRPVVPLPKTATPPAPAQSRAPAPAAADSAAGAAAPSAAAPAPAAASPSAPSNAPAAAADSANKESSGWQTAGADAKRQSRPQAATSGPVEKDGTMGYVKYVTDKVQDADLRSALAAHGELTYFDINRQKVCAPHLTPF